MLCKKQSIDPFEPTATTVSEGLLPTCCPGQEEPRISLGSVAARGKLGRKRDLNYL